MGLGPATAYGHVLPNLIEEMQRIGTAPAEAPSGDYVRAIAPGDTNRRTKAPGSFRNRYHAADFGHRPVPFLVLAAITGVETPTARALPALGATAAGQAPGPSREPGPGHRGLRQG